jgi:ribosomal protein L29
LLRGLTVEELRQRLDDLAADTATIRVLLRAALARERAQRRSGRSTQRAEVCRG